MSAWVLTIAAPEMPDETRHVLISYKREDETKVDRLIRALQHHGLIIWWDQGLPGGEEWRANIESALHLAGCVVVVWPRASVGPGGDFVRDEASRARARGVLVPVMIDKVRPPLGFGELQSVDLTRWRGAPDDPILLDLVALCRSKLSNAPAPAAIGPGARLLRTPALGAATLVSLAAVAAFGFNLGSIQNTLCSAAIGQPALSDACGGLGMGGRPSRPERIAWAARDPTSCSALSDYLRRRPTGAYRWEAISLLQSARPIRATASMPVIRTEHGYVGGADGSFGTRAAAEQDARRRVAEDASSVLCQPVEGFERLASTSITDVKPDCRTSPLGHWACAAQYTASCRLATFPMVQTCG